MIKIIDFAKKLIMFIDLYMILSVLMTDKIFVGKKSLIVGIALKQHSLVNYASLYFVCLVFIIYYDFLNFDNSRFYHF